MNKFNSKITVKQLLNYANNLYKNQAASYFAAFPDNDNNYNNNFNKLQQCYLSSESSYMIKPSKFNVPISQPINMATSSSSATLDISLFKLRLDAFQPYEGNPETLNNFILQTNRLLEYYPNATEPAFQTIFDQIRAKLRRRAALQFGAKHFNDWNSFLVALKLAFSFGKDLNNYREDIINCKKSHQESTLDFAYRVRNNFDLIIDFLNAQNYTDSERATISKECESLVINNIIHNCPHDLQRHFFTMKPTTTHEVITEIQRDNFFRELHQPIRQNFNSISPRPSNQLKPGPPPFYQ